MIRRILIAGNSHVGSLKAGFSELAKHRDLNGLHVDFLSCRQPLDLTRGFNAFYLDINQRICATSDAMQMARLYSTVSAPVDIHQYNHVLIAAGPCLLHPYLYYDLSQLSIPLLSESVITSIASSLTNTASDNVEISFPLLALQLKQYCNDRLVYVGSPLPGISSPVMRFLSKLQVDSLSRLKQNTCSIRSSILQLSACKSNIFIPDHQLLEHHGIATKDIYMRDGVRVDGATSNPDMRHANADYGLAILEKIFMSLNLFQMAT